jgi:hypothetical protein
MGDLIPQFELEARRNSEAESEIREEKMASMAKPMK